MMLKTPSHLSLPERGVLGAAGAAGAASRRRKSPRIRSSTEARGLWTARTTHPPRIVSLNWNPVKGARAEGAALEGPRSTSRRFREREGGPAHRSVGSWAALWPQPRWIRAQHFPGKTHSLAIRSVLVFEPWTRRSEAIPAAEARAPGPVAGATQARSWVRGATRLRRSQRPSRWGSWHWLQLRLRSLKDVARPAWDAPR